MATNRIEEKRSHRRFKFQAPLRYQLRGTSEFNNTISDDISEGGVSFVNSGYLPKSALIMLEISLLSRILNPVGKVVWSQPLPHSNRYKVGIEFLELSQEERKYLGDYCNMQLNNAM
jgi:hypothetical protein